MTLDRGLDTEIGEPKYARMELERRWLLDPAARPGLVSVDFTLIEDLYIDGTRLRLRRMIQQASGRTVWKLTKKYDTERPEARPIVTAYLTRAEFDIFEGLQGNRLTKKRYRLDPDGRTWSVDLSWARSPASKRSNAKPRTRPRWPRSSRPIGPCAR